MPRCNSINLIGTSSSRSSALSRGLSFPIIISARSDDVIWTRLVGARRHGEQLRHDQPSHLTQSARARRAMAQSRQRRRKKTRRSSGTRRARKSRLRRAASFRQRQPCAAQGHCGGGRSIARSSSRSAGSSAASNAARVASNSRRSSHLRDSGSQLASMPARLRRRASVMCHLLAGEQRAPAMPHSRCEHGWLIRPRSLQLLERACFRTGR